MLFAFRSEASVTLIGVDGASWNLIDPMLASGELPNIAALIARGATANLETVEPVTSPVVWTSIATGRSPAAHGVTDFFATRLSIRAPSSFERLAHSGLRVGLYDYLVTWPPAVLHDGFVIPGWLRRDASLTPTNLWERVGLEPFANSFDGAMTSRDYLERAERDVAQKAKRWNALAAEFQLDVGAVTFYAVDMTSHRFWEAAFPDQFEEPAQGYDARERNAIHNALRGVDRSIGEIAAQLTTDDTILICSDHGFRANPDGSRDVWVTDLDATLAREDLVEERDGFSVLGTFGAIAIRIQPGPIAARDVLIERLRSLLRSFRNPAGDRLFLIVEAIDIASRPPDAQRGWFDRTRQWIVKAVAERVFNVNFDPTAQAVIIALPDHDAMSALWPDGRIQIGDTTLPIQRVLHRQRFTGTHDPIGIFIAAGGPIAAREARGQLSVLDIAPMVFYAAGQPIPDDLEGTLHTKWIRDEYWKADIPKTVPSSRYPSVSDPGDTPDGQDPSLIEKLRSLGYIE